MADVVPAGLGFGGAAIGNHRTAVADADATAAVERAWERGIRYFDTAPHYGLGLSERRLGRSLRHRPRDELVVSTKVGRLLVPRFPALPRDDDGFDVPGDLQRRWDFTPDGVARSLAESCERLGLDRIDVALVHDPDQAWPGAARAGLESLTPLRTDGLVGAAGIGTNSTAGLAELIADGLVDVVLLANRFTVFDHRDALPMLDVALHASVTVVAAGVFAGGRVASAGPRSAGRLADVCAAHEVDPAAVAIAFPFLHPAVTTVLVGMRSAREVDENADRYAAGVPAGVWADLVSAGLLHPDVIDRRPNGRDTASRRTATVNARAGCGTNGSATRPSS